MGTIKALGQDLINKIAAGEVIERPASVVKELVENSIDAGATKITIEVVEGGQSLIRISDNGLGIAQEDLELAIKRHTTSKIGELKDLFSINTLGFRGEALASIASVSRMEIATKTQNDETGNYIEVESGDVKQRKQVAINRGTTISVHNLFFNVPARKKHLKTIATEFRKILEIITQYALINSQIYFHLVHNGKTVIDSPATDDWLANIASIYGREVTRHLVEVEFSFFDISVKGFICIPGKARGDRTMQSIFINGRHVQNPLIQRAVYVGYGSLLFHGRHPIFVLSVTVDPKTIDVNVHPNKSQIRIEKESELFSTVKNAVVDALKDKNLVPEMFTNKSDFGREVNAKLVVESAPRDEQVYLDEDVEIKRKKDVGVRILGRIYQTYIIAEDDKGMLLIDQHAAHERVMFERFMKQFKKDDIRIQSLLKPLMLELGVLESNIIMQNIDLFAKCGIAVEEFGKNTFIVRSLPSVFARQQDKKIVLDIIDELAKGELKKFSTIKEERIAMAACRSAVKAHDYLEMPQMYKIIEELFSCDNPYSCPHGRPSMINYTLYDLEKKFKRKV